MSPPTYLTENDALICEFIENFDIAMVYGTPILRTCAITKRIGLGVILNDGDLISGSARALHWLRAQGKRIILVMNNTSKSRHEHAAHLQARGIDVNMDEIITSAYSTVLYISDVLRLSPPGDTVFLIGHSGIEQEMRLADIVTVGETDPAFQRGIGAQDFCNMAAGSHSLRDVIGVVVVGLDLQFNYLKLCHALHYIRNGATHMATKLDATFPYLESLFPGTGSISAALASASGHEPLLMRKPEQMSE
ncbi:HAD-like domain-containing protein [Xylariaceae sp. FL0255]|nr:HAD-like domain-containing protein [Xylariaceae sp. FL0255]